MAASTTDPRRAGLGARSKARRRALDVLFEAEQRHMEAGALLAERVTSSGTASSSLPEYAVTLVQGVAAHREEIDEMLATYSHGWTLDRMPSVDRAALRIGAFELLHADDVPDAVAISEAVAMVAALSTDDSPAFVNGLLARVMEVKPA